MKLPKIQEDQYPLKNTYFQSIAGKPLKKYKTQKLIFDWQAAEVELISRIPDQEELLQQLIQLQNACRAFQIPHFYSYFFVSHLLFKMEAATRPAGSEPGQPQQKTVASKRIKEQVEQLKSKKSKWHKILQLIQLRQNLVSKINKNVADNSLEVVYTYLDDIRFINFEIIKKISQWSTFNETDSQVHPFFLYEGNNYLIKMINDNTNVINVLNGKAVKFLSPPNPFYLSRDGNKTSMSQTQQSEIDSGMQLLAKEKAQELRMIINPPSFVYQSKNETTQLKKLKNQLQSQKVERIKNAYKTSFSTSSLNMRNSLYSNSEKNKTKQKQEVQRFHVQRQNKFSSDAKKLKNQATETNVQKRNRFQKMIQDKEVAVVQQLKNSQIRLKNLNKSSSKEKFQNDNKGVNKYLSKVESLRKSVQQNKNAGLTKLQPIMSQHQNAQSKGQNLMRLSTISNKNQLPKTVAQIKAPKPKIRLIMEKQSIVEDVVKALLPQQNVQLYKSLNVRRSAISFFKPSQTQKDKSKQKIEQKKQKVQSNIDIKPVTQYSRTLSASNLSQHNFLKSNSKTKTKNMFSSVMNKTKEKQNKSKSRTLSEKSQLSLLRSPSKRLTVGQLGESEYEAQNDQTDGNLRAVNSKLRDLTIMSIYGKKNKVNAKPYNPYQSTVSKLGNKKVADQRDNIDAQLKAVKNRLKDLSKAKIFDRKSSTKDFKSETVLVQKQKKIKEENEKNSEQLEQQQKRRQQMIKNLQQKDKRIEQLLGLLKMEEKKDKGAQNKKEQQVQLIEERQKKMKQIQLLKQKIRSQNKLIKEQMQLEEKKYIELKQKEYEMKEQEMARKYQLDMQQMKQEYIKKNKELEAKVMEEEKVRKQQQIKMLKEKREMEELKMQMEEKKLKQQLLEEILKEHKQKQEKEDKESLESQLLLKQKLKRQLIQKQELQRKMLQNFEEDNRKLIQMFEQMKRKNEEAQKQNQRKLLQIKRIEQQTKREEQNLRKLEAELLEAKQILERQESPQKSHQQNEEASQVEDIQQVKLRVKQEILRQIMAKRRQEEEQVKAEKEERARKLAEIQEQIRNELRRQEEEMERIQKQQRQKYERIKKQIEQEHRKKMELLDQERKPKQKDEQQENKAKQETQKQQQINNSNQIDNKISKQQYEKQLQKSIQNSKNQAEEFRKLQQERKNMQLKKIQEQNKRKQEDKKAKQLAEQEAKQQEAKQQAQQQSKQQAIKENEKEQKPEAKDEKQKKKQGDLQKVKTEKNQLSEKKDQPLIKQKQEELKEPSKDQRSKEQLNKSQVKKSEQTKKQQNIQQESGKQTKKQTQTIKQSSDQILTKYQNLQQHLSKCKQIYLDDKAFSDFLDTFYTQFAPEVKQMLPYGQNELLKFASTLQKKIDIFECPNGHSIGWLEAERYVLIGQISCIQNIVRKYGQVQIEMTYIFNKTNPYQKQFLAKQVKIFDKVGYIFQKKLKQQNMFSIKLIVKVPVQILGKNFKQPTNQLRINSRISIDLISKLGQKVQNKKNCYSYMLSQTLRNCLGAEEQLEFKEDKSEENRIVQNKMHHKLYNDNVFKSEEIDDKKMKIQANLDLKYMQTHQGPCYLMKGSQCINLNSNSSQKVYVVKINESLSIVAFAYDGSLQQFSLDVLLSIKIGKLEKQRQLLICMPVWSKSQDIKLTYPGPKQFLYANSVDANLIYGSLISNSVLKQQYVYLQAPFVFALFQTNAAGLLLRPLHGQVVEMKDITPAKK